MYVYTSAEQYNTTTSNAPECSVSYKPTVTNLIKLLYTVV